MLSSRSPKDVIGTARAVELPVHQLCAFFEKLRIGSDAEYHVRDNPGSATHNRIHEALLSTQSDSISTRISDEDVAALHDRVIAPFLRSLLPQTDVEVQPPSSDAVTKIDQLSAAYLKLLIYAATNNLAAVEHLVTLPMMYAYLKPMVDQLLQMRADVFARPGFTKAHPSLKPLAKTFFRCAVEVGDAGVIKNLCLCEELGVDINKQVIIVDKIRWTPSERAAYKRFVKATETLIALGADVKKSSYERTHRRPDEPYYPLGALECALHTDDMSQPIDMEIVRLLLDAGGVVATRTLLSLADNHDVSSLELIWNARTRSDYIEWTEKSLFHKILRNGEPEACIRLLQRLKDAGGNVNHRMGDDYGRADVLKTPPYPPHMIDVAISRGEHNLVEAMLEHGSALMEDSLTAAVRSRNPYVMHTLLNLGADADGFSLHFLSTPYAEALIQQDTELASLFENRGCLKNIHEPYRLTAALAAASKIGDLSMVKNLLPLARGDHQILGYALVKAESNCTAITQVLLEAGAAIFPPEYLNVFGQSPNSYMATCISMDTAIDNKNQSIVRLLLDRGGVEIDSVTSLRKAITARAVPIVQDLVEAGVREERGSLYGEPHCLKLAVRNRDHMLVEYLVSHGFAFGKALNEAVKISDLDMVCKLLKLGATPDSETLVSTFCKPIAFFEVVWPASCNFTLTENGELSAVLAEALLTDRLEIVRVLLQHQGAQTTYVDFSRQGGLDHFGIRLNKDRQYHHLAPIAVAILHDRTTGFQTVQLLLNSGVDLDSIVTYVDYRYERKSKGAETALLLAIGIGRADLVELLIDHGANVNQPNRLGIRRTPLQKAAETGSYSIVHRLLQHGADPNGLPSARNGGTALQFAAKGGFTSIFDLLLRHGADINASPSKIDGRTPLEGAAERGRFDMVIYLLKLNFRLRGGEIDSARAFAESNGHSAIVDVLDCYCQEREPMPVIGYVEERKGHYCDVCQLPLCNASARARHRNTIHASELARARFACEDCGKVFGRKDLLKRHKTTHSKQDYVLCGSCGKKFRKDYLKTHLRFCQQRK